LASRTTYVPQKGPVNAATSAGLPCLAGKMTPDTPDMQQASVKDFDTERIPIEASRWLMMAQALLFVLTLCFFAISFLGSAPRAFFPSYELSFQTACLNFEPLKYVSNSAVNIQEFVVAGTTLQFPDNDPSCGTANRTVSVDICRIVLNISTSDRSGIIFEGWLPRNWTGRFLATGNGGIDVRIMGCLECFVHLFREPLHSSYAFPMHPKRD
jgi:hypothetical protein